MLVKGYSGHVRKSLEHAAHAAFPVFLFPGILYINPADLGWNPPVSSWIDKREVQSEKANLTILFYKYLPSCLDTLRSRYHAAEAACRCEMRFLLSRLYDDALCNSGLKTHRG